MESIKIFNNPQFGEIRTAGTPENPLFCLADVCKALDLVTTKVAQRLSDDVLSKHPITDSLGREQQANFITEDGLYDVILDSRKPEAKAFRKWITSEVIPSIRKHGAYMTEDTLKKALTSPDFLIQLATELKAEQEANRQLKAANAEQIRQIEEMQPKTLFAEAVSSSSTSILVGELAKILKQNGIEIGQNRLFKWMRDNRYLMYNNIPYQKYMEMGLFEIKENTIVNPDGSIRVTRTTKVTGKGQIYFINLFLNEKAA